MPLPNGVPFADLETRSYNPLSKEIKVDMQDSDGNRVDLQPLPELMSEILLELRAIHAILEEISDIKISKEEVNGT